MNNYKKSNNGFTLIEIMVTVAIVGIFASIALPSFARLIENNQVSTRTNELVSNLLLTKSEALKRSNSVTLCASTNQTSCNGGTDFSQGWIVFLDCNTATSPIGTRVTGAVPNCGPNNREELIKVGDGYKSFHIENPTRGSVTFNFTGRPQGQLSSFVIGPDDSDLRKRISLSLVGRITTNDLP